MKKQLFVCLALLLLFAVCGATCQQQCRITPPITYNEQDRTNVVDITAKLDKLQSSGEFKISFEKTVKQNFDKLNDSNASLLLFLEAIDCALERGKIGQDTAKGLVEILRARWGAKNSLGGLPQQLSPIEKDLISKSPQSNEILEKLKSYGVQ